MTISLGDISIRYVHLLLNAAKSSGIDTYNVTEQFLLTHNKMHSPYTRISIPRFMRIGERLINQSGQYDLGLKCGQFSRLHDLGLVGSLASSADTVAQALKEIIHFEKLNSHNLRGQSSIIERPNKLTCSFYSISPYNAFNYFVVDMALRSTVNFVNELSGTVIRPERINFEFPSPHYAEAYATYFDAPIYFNQSENAVIYNAKTLSVTPRNANPITYLELKQICSEQLEQIKHNVSFIEQVMNEIGPLLTQQKPSMEQVAHNIGMPPWTLRRRLKEENVCFKDLLDQTRKSLAAIYTKDVNYSLEEISFLLGFSNPTAFHRAFKRWFNCTASEYRQALTI
jgi:AraC-like DNA-binding protein